MIRSVVGGVLALVAALAGGCNPEATKPSTARVVADSADQVLFKMTTVESTDGLRRTVVYAETAFVYQNTQRMDLRRLQVTFFDEQGKQSGTLAAKHGLYTITNGSLDARGGVEVHSTDGKVLLTEHLIYDKGALQLRSDTAFTYISPTERLTGVSGTSDLEFKHVVVDRPRGNQRGGGVMIPGK